MMNEINFREVCDSDWDFLTKIRNASNEFHRNTSIFTILEYKKYILNQLTQNKNNRHWIIMYNNKMMGHAKIINQDIGYIFAPEFQGKGLLKFVFRVFEIEVAKLGYSSMLSRVKINNPISLWQFLKHGWIMTGVEMNDNPNLIEYKLSKNIIS